MEACSSAHHWARKLIAVGHEVRLMAPQFVKPYVKTNNNDRNDAEAICEAVARPNMRFVPVKTPEQQTVLRDPESDLDDGAGRLYEVGNLAGAPRTQHTKRRYARP
jgi:transposase